MYATVYEKGRRRLTKLRNLQTVKKPVKMLDLIFPLSSMRIAKLLTSTTAAMDFVHLPKLVLLYQQKRKDMSVAGLP